MHGLALPAAGSDCADGGGRSLFGLSLCAGAGGLDLGLHIAVPAYRTVGYVERDAYAAATLVARMADAALDRAPVWDDVATFDGRPWRGVVDLVHGGYPCQPFSVAGRKLGDKDPRHLWPHIARIVREAEPPLCFFENVGGHLRLGFEQVADDLRAMGYRVAAGLFTAEEVGAPHKRERLFILAHAEGAGERRAAGKLHQAQRRQDGALLRFAHGANGNLVADRDGDGLACHAGATACDDDPQGRAQRPANAVAGGDGDTAGRLSLREAGSGTGGKETTLSRGESPLADAAHAGSSCGRLRRERSGAQPKPRQNCAAGVVDSAPLQRREVERTQPHGNHAPMVDSDCAGLERRRVDREQDEDPEQPFPPGPSDKSGWERYLRQRPDLEPAVRGGADGLAHRVDRLRVCGNGVVPLAAAYALRTLAAAAGIDIDGT